MHEDFTFWMEALEQYASRQKVDWVRPEDIAHLPAPARWLMSMLVVEGMIGNGGFHALWYNHVDGFLPAAIEGYEAIGLPQLGALLRRAVEMVAADPYAGPRDIWPDPDAEERPEGRPDIGDLEDEWYPLERSLMDAIDRAKADLVRTRPEVFEVMGRVEDPPGPGIPGSEPPQSPRGTDGLLWGQ